MDGELEIGGLNEEISLEETVQVCARRRGQLPIDLKFIRAAGERILAGLEPDIERYPTGLPTMRSFYDVAARLEQEEATIN